MIVFTVIVTYNGMKWIKRCLDSLRQSSVPTIPIIIDNNSSDDSVTFVKENYQEAVVFQEDINHGFGQANNIGIKYALEHDADYVFLLNQDASINPDTLQLLVDASDGKSLLSPIHLNGYGSQLDNNFKNSLMLSDNALLDDFILSRCKTLYKTENICAACWFMPIYIIKNIGGFNPIFFHYGEDNNYNQRLKFHGIESFVVPKAFMFHDREKQFGNSKIFYNKWVYRMLLLIATDINASFNDRLKQYFHQLICCYKSDIWRHNYIFGTFTLMMIKILFNKGKINNSRLQEKQRKINWL